MQFRGKGRPELSLASHYSHYVTTLASWIVYSCRGGPAVQNESPALQPPQSVESSTVIFCFPLLVPAAIDHPTCPVQCLVGLGDSASIKKAMDQVQLRNNYYMMTQKMLRREKGFQEQEQIGRWKMSGQMEGNGVQLSNSSLHIRIITCLTRMVKMGVSLIVQG